MVFNTCKTSYHFCFLCHASFARYAYAAEQAASSDELLWHCGGMPFTCEPNRPLFQCNGCVHCAAEYVDKAVQFADEHQGLLTGLNFGLHTGVGLVIGGPAGAAGGALDWAVDQVKGELTHQVLGPTIDKLVQRAAEKIAPEIMKYDPQATEEEAIKVASALAAGSLNSYNFGNFIKNFKTYDFSRAKIGKALHKLATPESGSNFAPEFAKILTEGIPDEVADSFEQRAFTQEMKASAADIKEQLAALKPLPISSTGQTAGNAYEALSKDFAQVLKMDKLPEYAGTPMESIAKNYDWKTGTLPPFPGTYMEPIANNIGQYFKMDKLPTFGGTPMESIAQTYDWKTGKLPQFSGTPMESIAKNYDWQTGTFPQYAGTPYQQLYENRNYYFSTDNQKKGY